MTLRCACNGMAGVVLAASLACDWPLATRAPDDFNLVLVTLDTMRADRIGAYADPRAAATPALDRLAREGILFEDVTSPAPLTLPAHCTLFTGRLPPRHGVRENASRLDGATPTLASVLQARGYRTAAFVSAEVLARSHGLYLGFDVYDDDLSRGATQKPFPRRRADEVVTRALGWMTAMKASRFFAWVHIYDAHAPYEAVSQFEAYRGRPYEAAVASIDAQIGRLRAFLERSGLLRRTVIAVIGDHGEALGDHGELTHGLFVYESVLRVPFILRAPTQAAQNRRVTTPVSSADVMPTLLDLLGAGTAADVDGESLIPVIEGRARHAEVYAENLYVQRRFGWSEMRAIRAGALKLIDKTNPELYDLERDPGETHDLASEKPAVVARLVQQLRRWHGMLEAGPATHSASSPPIGADVRARLASLGYLAVSLPTRTIAARAPAADPRDHVEEFNRVTVPCATASIPPPAAGALAGPPCVPHPPSACQEPLPAPRSCSPSPPAQ